MESLWNAGGSMCNYFNVLHTDHYNNYEKSRPETLTKRSHWPRRPIDPALLQVRDSIGVVGFQRDAILKVKRVLSDLLPTPIALEGLHIKSPSDVKDGAFLVPKLVLVVTHVVGRKLIDERGDEGQLDYIYDEAGDVQADIMVIYLGLPKVLYPPMRHIVYHPKAADLIFPESEILRDLANENCFLTVTEGAELNSMQKNVLKEWAIRMVTKNHPIYKTASHLATFEKSGYMSMPEFQTYSSPAAMKESKAAYYTEVDEGARGYQYATEEHPLADRRAKKKKKEKRMFKFRKESKKKKVPTATLR